MRNAVLGATSAIVLVSALPASAGNPNFSYVPNSLMQSTIISGPWTLHESASSFAHDASGIVPPSTQTMPPYVGTGVPYAGYCTPSGEVTKNHGPSLMQPYYFPFVRARGPLLQGFFDYRPRNQQEVAVSAFSNDWGVTWHFTGQALALNPYCPFDATDPDNRNVSVGGLAVAYGSSSANAADNGLGHPVVLTVNGVDRLYQLNRANGHIDFDQLVVHTLPPGHQDGSVSSLPDFGYVSPLASGGYPTLTPALATTGLNNPDAFIGAVPIGGGTTAVVYVGKQLDVNGAGDNDGDVVTSPPTPDGDADIDAGYTACPSTPPFALTNFVNGKARKPNHDVITVHVATTTDGIAFTEVGAVATGPMRLFDPNTIDLSGTRWLGSGSLIPLADGRYGMFFGAGNCLDNDSDGFHYIGYAETKSVVNTAADLLSWTVLNALDNPILSTDTVYDNIHSYRPYPLNVPVVDAHGVDALTASQVAPFKPAIPPQTIPPTPPFKSPLGGYNSNFFSGRVYDPQALYTDDQTLTIVFAGYNTPQPSNNLGDYRTIGRFQLKVTRGYFKAPQ
jgi:hypothetical protein